MVAGCSKGLMGRFVAGGLVAIQAVVVVAKHFATAAVDVGCSIAVAKFKSSFETQLIRLVVIADQAHLKRQSAITVAERTTIVAWSAGTYCCSDCCDQKACGTCL